MTLKCEPVVIISNDNWSPIESIQAKYLFGFSSQKSNDTANIALRHLPKIWANPVGNAMKHNLANFKQTAVF